MPLFSVKELTFREALTYKKYEFFDSIILTVLPQNTNTVTVHTYKMYRNTRSHWYHFQENHSHFCKQN